VKQNLKDFDVLSIIAALQGFILNYTNQKEKQKEKQNENNR
jgi:hypothetical protein